MRMPNCVGPAVAAPHVSLCGLVAILITLTVSTAAVPGTASDSGETWSRRDVVGTGFSHGTPPCEECVALQQAIDVAITTRAPSFTVAPPRSGTAYMFGSSSLTLADATDFVLILNSDGNDVALVFDIGGGVGLLGCRNVTVQGGIVDYMPTLAQGRVVTSTLEGPSPSITADFDPAFLKPDPAATPFFNQSGSIKVAFWDPTTKTMMRGNGTLPEAINIFAECFSAVGPWRYRIGLTGNRQQLPASLTVGTPVTVFPRGGQHSLRLINCTECTVTNLTIHGGSSMGIVDSDGAGGNTYLAVTIARMDTPSLIGLPPRLLATNADGFHSTTNRRGPALLRSEIGFTGDDAGNICSAMSVLLPPPPAHTGVQQRRATPSALFVDVGGNLKTAVKGDVILFYNISTGEPLGEATVAAVPTSTSAAPSVQTMRQAFATMMAPPISAHFVTEVQGHFERGLPVVVPLTAPLAPALQGLWSVGVLMSTANAGAMVHDTVIHDAYARAFMIKGRNATYLRNTLARAGGVHVGPAMVWLEGDPGQRDVLIADSSFDHIGSPAVSVDPSVAVGHDITVVNNTNH